MKIRWDIIFQSRKINGKSLGQNLRVYLDLDKNDSLAYYEKLKITILKRNTTVTQNFYKKTN